MRSLFGDEVIDQTSVVWGTDDEGELNGSYRPSGHPGVRAVYSSSLQTQLEDRQLWFAPGDFGTSRFYTKQLVFITFHPPFSRADVFVVLQAMEIKAIELGLLTL
jgi:hypothetical protein